MSTPNPTPKPIPITLKLRVKGYKELKAMGVGSGTKLMEKGVYGEFFDFTQLEYDTRFGNKFSSSRWYAREERLRIATEYLEFDFEQYKLDNAEYFI